MKEMRIELEFTTGCLALSGARADEVDKFDRDSSGDLVWNQSWWYSAISSTIDMYGIRGIKPSMFSFDPVVKAKTDIYRRKYAQNAYRQHERIAPGTSVTFNAVVADQVTYSTLRHLLDKMGRYVGLSPYGHKLGYGKFTVRFVDLTECSQCPTD